MALQILDTQTFYTDFSIILNLVSSIPTLSYLIQHAFCVISKLTTSSKNSLHRENSIF